MPPPLLLLRSMAVFKPNIISGIVYLLERKFTFVDIQSFVESQPSNLIILIEKSVLLTVQYYPFEMKSGVLTKTLLVLT